jgi:hypothetical protein
VGEEIAQANLAAEADGEEAARRPLGVLLVERMGDDVDGVAERLEEAAEQSFAPAARDGGERGFEGQGGCGGLGAVSATATEGAAEDLAARRPCLGRAHRMKS